MLGMIASLEALADVAEAAVIAEVRSWPSGLCHQGENIYSGLDIPVDL